MPATGSYGSAIPGTSLALATAQLKRQLLSNSQYIKSIIVVPEEDLRGKISLERIRSLYNGDIAFLLSYMLDQRTARWVSELGGTGFKNCSEHDFGLVFQLCI
ncbi:hypothetical protein KEF85_16530 [Methylomonas paludis]|uniref:Uncharacterized protein n=1 Tax=Methylomonas paludis TaxID=1173101 RepID=A0A975MN79_9GAMM|nr:hypothetical protein [Methylomonas paludis]QWF70887.1 hypothetical protein KEF85_16530 [Methylomonas paludis]